MLKTQIFENICNLSSEEKILAFFSRIIECDKPQGTKYKRPQGILTTTVGVIRSTLQDLRGCWKHKFLKIYATFPVEKRFWPFFLGLSSVTYLKRQTVRVQKVVWQLLRNLQDQFYLATPSSLVKTKTFEKKKAIFPVKKSFWPVFPQSIECEKASGRFLRVHNVFWQLLWKLLELFCNTYEVVENKTSWKKGKLSSEKTIVAYFSRGIERDKCQQTPYKGPECWQILCKLWVCFYKTY